MLDEFYPLAMSYEKDRRYSEAIDIYNTVINMFPGLLKPRYLLARLCYNQNDEGFVAASQSVINFKTKIPSYDIYKMKAEISDLRSRYFLKK